MYFSKYNLATLLFLCGAVGIENFFAFFVNLHLYNFENNLQLWNTEAWSRVHALGSIQISLCQGRQEVETRICVWLWAFIILNKSKCQNDPKFVPEETDDHVGPLRVADHLHHSSHVKLRRTDFWVARQCQRVFLRSHRKGNSGNCGISGKHSDTSLGHPKVLLQNEAYTKPIRVTLWVLR